MTIVKVDKDYKISLNKFKDRLKIKPLDSLRIQIARRKLIIEKAEVRDPLIEVLENPAHVDKEKLKLDLKKLEEEMWTE